MKEYTQTVLGKYGNCYGTCIAGIFEIDPERMPVLSTDDDEIECHHLTTCNQVEKCTWTMEDKRNQYWRDMWNQWFTLNNITSVRLDAEKISQSDRKKLDFWHICTGISPRDPEQKENFGRGLLHAVIGKKGVIRHDPHPDRTGLLAINEYEFLVPTDLSIPVLEGYRLGTKSLGIKTNATI